MNNSFHKILSCLAITGFLFYWVGVFILALPSNDAKRALENNIPRFGSLFSNSWKLFSPPDTYNNRLYFIARDINSREVTDTIEVLASLSMQKQNRAPFNQRENILDHLVNNSVSGLIVAIWGSKNLQPERADTIAATGIAIAIARVKDSKNYNRHLATLNNYCKQLLREWRIDSHDKEVKIVITQKMMRPFKEMANPHFLQKEIIVFESSFKPVNQ